VVARADYDLVIVGAGIAGSALACSLQDSDLRIALVEANTLNCELQAPTGGPGSYDGRVSALTPASQRLLESLQAWRGIIETRACPYGHMSVWDGEGTGAIEFDADDVGVPVLGHIVENRVITAALLQRVRDAGGVEFINPARVADVLRADNEAPSLVLEDGREISAQLLVGADGALSRLREMAGFRTREWDYGHHALVCTVEIGQSHQATAYQRFLTSGPLAFLPLPEQDGRHFCSIVWSAETAVAEELKNLDDDSFLHRLSAAIEGRLGSLLEVSPRFSFPLRQRHATDYVQPGIALVGDAAHTIHPLAGQGINLGLQDVAVLSAEISAAVQRGRNPGDHDLLLRYQRQRKGENLLMMVAMDGFRRLFGEQPLPLRWLRSSGMRMVNAAGPVKQQLMRHAMGIR
jgi:2-octaprenylphenol hydroxylase